VLCIPFQETCNINQRLPSFALKLNKRGDLTTTQQGPPVASRQEGGVCYMRRLTRVNNTEEEYNDPSIQMSTQMCMHNTSKLSCSVLHQNSEDVSLSHMSMKYYDAHIPEPTHNPNPTLMKTRKKTLCSQCESHDITKIMNRLGIEEDILSTTQRQLSTGKPFRISTSRMLYSHLRRAVCHTDTDCSVLHDTIMAKIPMDERETVCGS